MASRGNNADKKLTMMLRSRSMNVPVAPAGRVGEVMGPVKRHADSLSVSKDEPKRKRPGLVDLSNAMSNGLLIDSSKKVSGKEPLKQTAKQRSTSKILEDGETEQTVFKEESPNPKRLSAIRESPVADTNNSIIVLDNVCNKADPCPEYDYDAENIHDQFAVAVYARDIFNYYISREKRFMVGNYLLRQPQVTKEMRAVLADWMVEIQESFELNHETLYLAIKLTDMYMDKNPEVNRDDLQLIGSTAVFIASKFDERSPPLIDDFIYICEDAYTRDMLIDLEQKMLKRVGFDLGCPLSYRFLRRYAKVNKVDMATLTLARFVLETSLMFYEFIPVSESLMAAATLLMAFRMKKNGDWNPVLVKYSGYKLEDIEELMWTLNHMMWMRPVIYSRLKTVFNKYSHEVFFKSAEVPLLEDRYTESDPVGPPAHLSFKC